MSNGRLLIVDDNEMNCDMLSRRLIRKGYEVAVAHDGYRALDLLREQRFDLIILDIMMPGMSGLQVLERVRETHSLTDLPVLMATAKVDSEYVVQALSIGANDYVTKPIDFPVVLARIETQLNVRQQLRGQVEAASAAGLESGAIRVLRTTGEFHKLEGSERPQTRTATHFCDSCASALLGDVERCPHCQAERPQEGWLPLAEADFPWLGETIGERYFLEGYIGSGTDGIVYRARDIDLQRPFAAKLINTEEGYSGLDPEKMRARVKMEVEAMVRLKNPHVVKIYEVVQVSETVFALVMDFVQGTTLGSMLQSQGQLRPEVALEIIRQASQGLYEAHQLGMIHRDIKPDNIMLEPLPAGGMFTRVLDFGIVAILDRPTGSASFYGTPLYTSPEQITGGVPVDHRADIYALGAVLHHMLTGQPPFVDESVARILNLHLQGPIPQLTLPFAPDEAEAAINALLLSMMAKNPAERPADLSEVIEAVDAIQRLIPRVESGRMARLPRPDTGPVAVAAAVAAAPPAPLLKAEAESTLVDTRSPYIRPVAAAMSWSRSLAIRPHLAPSRAGVFAEQTQDGSLLHILDLAEGTPTRSVSLVNARVVAACLAWKSRRVVIADEASHQLCVVDIFGQGVTHNWSIPGEPLTAVSCTPDASVVAAGARDGHVYVAATAHKRQAYRLGAAGNAVTALALSPRQTEVAVGYQDGTIELLPLSARGMRASLQRLNSPPTSMAFSAEADQLVALTRDGDVALFNTRGGGRVARVGFGKMPMMSIALDADHRILALIAEGRTLRLWDLSDVFTAAPPAG